MSPRSAGPVVVVTLGGTIAMSTTAAGGVAPALTADDILGAVPGLAQTGTEVRAVDFRRLPGASLSFSDLDALHQHIHQVLDGGAAGVVVVQGTDTIEESAYHLELKHTRPQPIVVTGAMRNPTLPGADGPANLLAAILTVAAPASHGRGVLVVLNDEIHTAAQVRKTHTTSTATFQSPDSGPAGHLVEHTVRYLTPPPPRLTVPPARAGSSPRVGLYTATLGDDGSLLNAIVDSPDALDGLVVAGMGVGHVPQPLVEPLARAATCMPVLLASRTGSGSALTGTYGFPGSERDLIARGLTSTGYLHPLKARILLRAALASGATGEQIRQAITAAGTADPSGWPWPATDTPVGVPS